MSETQVLVAGAGPTGLVLALWLTRLGVRVRIIDEAAEPGTTSRALVVQARTLEFYSQIGLAQAVVAGGLELAALNLWVQGRRVAHLPFGASGTGISPFPHPLIYPQDQHERLLIDRLAAAGVTVERRAVLLGFEDEGGRILARLRRADAVEEICAADYLAGCDGARSTVREALGTGFPGGTYADLYYVADVDASGPVMNGELHVALDEADFIAVFPLQGAGRARLIGVVRRLPHDQQAKLTWEDVSPAILRRMGITVERVNWFSTYHVHHRVAAQFRKGRAFLLGDAAHIHSPVGGQGMNTGIGDAVNLAWKLAAVLTGRADPRLLDSYEPERIAFARRLVATTDRAFTLVTSRGPVARRARVDLVPRLFPVLFRLRLMRRLLFRTISQTRVRYRASSLSAGRAGRIRGGDRLPWVMDSGNFTALTTLDWQVHVYGDPRPDLVAACAARQLPLHAFPWRRACRQAGLRRNAAYLVRPDGYVAVADPYASAAKLGSYLDAHGLRPVNATPA